MHYKVDGTAPDIASTFNHLLLNGTLTRISGDRKTILSRREFPYSKKFIDNTLPLPNLGPRQVHHNSPASHRMLEDSQDIRQNTQSAYKWHRPSSLDYSQAKCSASRLPIAELRPARNVYRS